MFHGFIIQTGTYTYVKVPVGSYWFISPKGHILIHSLLYGTKLIHILRRRYYPHTHIFICLILIQISRRSYRAYAYTEVPLGTTKLTLMP